MTIPFDAALAFVLEYEGGYSDHPADPGGATNLGISYRFLKQGSIQLDLNHDGKTDALDIKLITRDVAADLYYDHFWMPASCAALPAALGFAHFDCAVNMGVRTAVRLLQKGLRSVVPTLETDGAFGLKSVAAVHKAQDTGQLDRVLREMIVRRIDRYAALSTFGTFGIGWLRRSAACLIRANALLPK